MWTNSWCNWCLCGKSCWPCTHPDASRCHTSRSSSSPLQKCLPCPHKNYQGWGGAGTVEGCRANSGASYGSQHGHACFIRPECGVLQGFTELWRDSYSHWYVLVNVLLSQEGLCHRIGRLLYAIEKPLQQTACCVVMQRIWNMLLIKLWIFWTGASAVSGFFASACSLPFDYVKTQIQKMQPGPDGKFPYTGSVDCALQTLKAGGPLKLYSGFGTYCIRIAPHVMVRLSFISSACHLPGKLFFFGGGGLFMRSVLFSVSWL